MTNKDADGLIGRRCRFTLDHGDHIIGIIVKRDKRTLTIQYEWEGKELNGIFYRSSIIYWSVI